MIPAGSVICARPLTHEYVGVKMKRRNFLKLSAGLPALALVPWSERQSWSKRHRNKDGLLIDPRVQRIFEQHANEFEPIEFDLVWPPE